MGHPSNAYPRSTHERGEPLHVRTAPLAEGALRVHLFWKGIPVLYEI
jgi:hypothetical protein